MTPLTVVLGVITIAVSLMSGLVAVYKMSVGRCEKYTDQQIKSVRQSYSERMEDLKEDIKELKVEVKELREENKSQTSQIIKLLTIAKKSK